MEVKFALNVNGVTFKKIAGRGALMTPLLSKALQVCGPRTLLEANLPMSEKRFFKKVGTQGCDAAVTGQGLTDKIA